MPHSSCCCIDIARLTKKIEITKVKTKQRISINGSSTSCLL
uniref:Uncharacterized protein n=1 Tax=Setaria italica TaxID=4555 RepID=K3Z265_SETIT